MIRFSLISALLILFVAPALAQPQTDRPLRIIGFGAHPDDCELKASGVARQWVEAGHHVKFVSVTNGDLGHFSESGGPLAQRRRAEVEACAEILGIETEVLNIGDGQLMPTMENRRKIARLIREWQADVVMAHRRWDYHADHRYVGELVDDASVLVVAGYFDPYSPRVERNPIVLYYSDGFQRPYPFQADLVVGIDDVADYKWDCLRQMPSQFADADSWQAVYLPGVPDEPQARADHIMNLLMSRSEAIADQYRDRLVELYGEERGRQFRYAEAFELGQYGRQVSIEELKSLFPSFNE